MKYLDTGVGMNVVLNMIYRRCKCRERCAITCFGGAQNTVEGGTGCSRKACLKKCLETELMNYTACQNLKKFVNKAKFCCYHSQICLKNSNANNITRVAKPCVSGNFW